MKLSQKFQKLDFKHKNLYNCDVLDNYLCQTYNLQLSLLIYIEIEKVMVYFTIHISLFYFSKRNVEKS